MPAADVVVVGAGPAGSATALLLARLGHDVALVDRAEFPRAKPCGDCLSAGAAAVLRRLGLLDAVQRLPHGRLREWHIVAPGGSRFAGRVADPPGAAMAVERRLLDAVIADAAISAGARLHQGVRVNALLQHADGTVCGVDTDQGPLRARLVVGADGLRSVVARRLGAIRRPPRLRKVSFTARMELPGGPLDVGEMHVLTDACVGIAPLRQDGRWFNVTVVTDSARFQALRQRPADFFMATLRRLPRLREALTDGGGTRDVELMSSGPFDQPVRRVTFDGAALAGDAAGYYDPFTGQGVTHALISAELLARTVDGALHGNDCSARALRPYARQLRTALRPARLVQHAVEAVTSRPATADRAINALRAAPRSADALVAVIGLAAPPRSLLSPAVIANLFRTLAGGPHDHQG